MLSNSILKSDMSGSDKMDTGLLNLLRKTTIDGGEFTHITFYGPHARWNIRTDALESFWTNYCNLVAKKQNNMCIAERPQQIMPIITRLTFKIINDRDFYHGKLLQWVCHMYQTVISEYFDTPTETKIELTAVIQEAEWDDENTETGEELSMMEISIQFPYGRVDAGLQNRLIRPRVIQLLRNNNIGREQGIDWEEVISLVNSGGPIIMYGSSEKLSIPVSQLTHIWNYIDETILNSDNDPSDIPLEEAFIPNNHQNVLEQFVNPEIFATNTDVNHWLPIFLSIGYWPSELITKSEANDGGRFIRQLNMMNTAVSELDFVPDSELDPYAAKHNDMLTPLMEKALSGYHRDVVNAMLFMFCKSPDTIDELGEYTHRYDSVTCNMFIWNYKSKIWECHEEQPGKLGGSPREKYFDFLIERIYKARAVLAVQVHESTDDYFKSNGDVTLKRMTKLIGGLSTVSYMDSVWKLFINKIKINFSKYCDEVTTELPLNDGTLYDIFTRESRLRTCRDLYTFTIKGHIDSTIESIKPDIPDNIHKNDYNAHQTVWTFFYELMSENEEMTIFLITTLAIYISGDLRDQSFLCINGTSNNGKSLLFKVLQWLLGDSMRPALEGVFISSARSDTASAHTTHLAALEKLRIAYLAESNPGDILSSANIKKITAGDPLATRSAYERVVNMLESKCHLMMATQHLPRMDTSDQGMVKRARIVNFKSWFKPLNPTYHNHDAIKIYDEDKSLLKKLQTPDCANALITMFSIASHQYYLQQYDYHIPNQIHETLQNYSSDSFVYSEFIQELCIVGPDKEIPTPELYKYYREYTDFKADSNKVFRQHMEKRYTVRRRHVGGRPHYIGINIDINKVDERNAQISSELVNTTTNNNVALWGNQTIQKYLNLNVKSSSELMSDMKQTSPNYPSNLVFTSECLENKSQCETIPTRSQANAILSTSNNIKLQTEIVLTPNKILSLPQVVKANPNKVLTPTPLILTPHKISLIPPVVNPTPNKILTPTPLILTSLPANNKITSNFDAKWTNTNPDASMLQTRSIIKPILGSMVKSKEDISNPPGTISI